MATIDLIDKETEPNQTNKNTKTKTCKHTKTKTTKLEKALLKSGPFVGEGEGLNACRDGFGAL